MGGYLAEWAGRIVFVAVCLFLLWKLVGGSSKQRAADKHLLRLDYLNRVGFDPFDISIDDMIVVSKGRVEVQINKEDFKDWLEEKNKLDWISDFNDPQQPDGHGQLTGTASFYQYLEADEKLIKADLAEYIKELVY